MNIQIISIDCCYGVIIKSYRRIRNLPNPLFYKGGMLYGMSKNNIFEVPDAASEFVDFGFWYKIWTKPTACEFL